MRRSFSTSLAISGLFVLNYLTSFARAYYIDDSDTTAIQYTPTRRWVHNSTDSNVDFSKLYNSTYTYALCYFSNGCKISIPFTGSGITVYHLQWDHLNASMTLDGNFADTYTHNVSCVRQSPQGCYNATLYDTQSLDYGDHVLEITMQDYLGDYSNFNFDYVFVNETRVTRPNATATATPTALTTTTAIAPVAASATATAILSDSPSKRTPTAAIVGGSIAGVVAVVAMILLVLYRRQARARKEALTFVVETPFTLPPATPGPMASPPLSTKMAISHGAPPVIPTAFRKGPPSSSSSSNPTDLRMSKGSTFGAGTSSSSAMFLSPVQAGETEHPTQDASSSQGHFTGEQISVMTQRLLRQNVPAPIVATVVQSMIGANTEASTPQAEGSVARSVYNSEAPPPSYDYQARSPRLDTV